MIGWIGFICLPLVVCGQMQAPEPNPPVVTAPAPARSEADRAPFFPLSEPPSVEWTGHKTADGVHPSGEEQQMLWLMNRARQNPRAEGAWLIHLRDDATQQALEYFSVNHALVLTELAAWASSNSAPAAFDARLYRAASNHCAYMISIDGQNHDGQFNRVNSAGFYFTVWHGSVFSCVYHPVFAHAGFNVDWGGDDGTGMQTGRGHRVGLMMGQLANVGIAFVAQPNTQMETGPFVVTINYAIAQTVYNDHYNRFIVGTVWHDANTNHLYEAGEGYGGVTVMPDRGRYYAITGAAGGYAIPIATSGVYTLTFSGGALVSNRTAVVTVGSDSVLADLELDPPPMDFVPTPTVNTHQQLTYTLPNQRLGIPYILLETTNLAANSWTWTGVLPASYGSTLTYELPLLQSNAATRFVTLQGWPY